jgi:hypothetical protein
LRNALPAILPAIDEVIRSERKKDY